MVIIQCWMWIIKFECFINSININMKLSTKSCICIIIQKIILVTELSWGVQCLVTYLYSILWHLDLTSQIMHLRSIVHILNCGTCKNTSITSFIIPLNFNTSRSSTTNTRVYMSKRWQKHPQGKLQSWKEFHNNMGEHEPSTHVSDIYVWPCAADLLVFEPWQTSYLFLTLHPFVSKVLSPMVNFEGPIHTQWHSTALCTMQAWFAQNPSFWPHTTHVSHAYLLISVVLSLHKCVSSLWKQPTVEYVDRFSGTHWTERI